MISAVVLTKNEENNLKRCLSSLCWCDEIILIDDFSSDNTLKIAEEYKTKVFQRNLEGNFSDQRNFGLKKAAGEWVLFVDADEEVPKRLKQEIIKATQNAKGINGFYLKRKDYFLGKWLGFGETARVRLLRLGRKGAGEWQGKVDEVWEIGGIKKTLKTPLLHYPHPNLTQFLESINERSTLNAQRFYEEGKRVSFFDWLKPGLKFFQNYFLRLGFLDGIQGFIFAILMSFHSFLVRGKLYLIWRKKGGWK